MAKKKKTKRFSAVTAVKEMARDRVGSPPVSKVLQDRRETKSQKHKPTISDLLKDSE